MQNPCLEYALSYLSRYPKTEQEMRILLYRKGYDTEQIQTTMKTLRQNAFINDEQYAQSYLYSEVIKGGKPVFLIKQKLLQRGIDKGIIDQLIEQQKQEIWEGIAFGIRKALEGYKKKGVDGFESIQKLIRKGYRLQDIKDVLQKK